MRKLFTLTLIAMITISVNTSAQQSAPKYQQSANYAKKQLVTSTKPQRKSSEPTPHQRQLLGLILLKMASAN